MNSQLFMHKNRKKIISELDYSITKDSENAINIFTKVDFLEPAGTSETHNGGRKPLLVTFDINGAPLHCVFKPRTADVDRAAYATFGALNHLELERIKEGRPPKEGYPLFTCKVIQPAEGGNWKRLDIIGEGSIWEYVKGKTVRDLGSRRLVTGAKVDGVSNVNQYVAKQQVLMPQLIKLELILREMEISDQNYENIMVTHLKKRKPTRHSQLAPIDMEVRKDPNGTHLECRVGQEKLSPEELACIRSNFSPSPTWTVRFVPIRTQTLLGRSTSILENQQELIRTAGDICENSWEWPNQRAARQDLERWILEDYLSGDVPFFTELQGTLFYGLPRNQRSIGKRAG